MIFLRTRFMIKGLFIIFTASLNLRRIAVTGFKPLLNGHVCFNFMVGKQCFSDERIGIVSSDNVSRVILHFAEILFYGDFITAFCFCERGAQYIVMYFDFCRYKRFQSEIKAVSVHVDVKAAVGSHAVIFEVYNLY